MAEMGRYEILEFSSFEKDLLDKGFCENCGGGGGGGEKRCA